MTTISKLSSIWGLYWLGYLTSWNTGALRREPTDKHRCCVHTPTQHVVWVACNDDVCMDYGRPYRYSYWKIFSHVEPVDQALHARSLSPYFSRSLSASIVGDKCILEVEEAKGFGYEFTYRKVILDQERIIDQAAELSFGRIFLSENRFSLEDDQVVLEIESRNNRRVIENGSAVVFPEINGRSIVFDKKEQTIIIKGPRRVSVEFKHIPRRWGWLQPFALVWDYIEDKDRVYAQYIEVYVGNSRYVFMSRNPIKALYEGDNEKLEVYTGGEIRIKRRDVKDLTSIGYWASMNVDKSIALELPTLRLSPSIIVPYLVKLQKITEDAWRLVLGLSNPTSINTSVSVLVDKPYFLESIAIDNEDVQLDKLNYLELFFPSYSAQTIEMKLKRKKEKMLLEKLRIQDKEDIEKPIG